MMVIPRWSLLLALLLLASVGCQQGRSPATPSSAGASPAVMGAQPAPTGAPPSQPWPASPGPGTQVAQPANASPGSQAPTVVAPPGAPVGSPSAVPPAPPAAGPSAAFDDVAGLRGEQEISALGVFSEISGHFSPSREVTRAEFVRWLVRASQVFWVDDPSSSRRIALARGTASTFGDVPTAHPDFPSIQGMVDAGYLTNFGKNRFRPDDGMTREEMIEIKVMLDQLNHVSHDVEPGQVARDWGFKDTADIAGRYLPAVLDDHAPYLTSGNIERVFGRVAAFEPRKAVTRHEAALCLAVQGARGSKVRSASEALRLKK